MSRFTNLRTPRTAAIVLLVAALTLAACSSDAKSAVTTTAGTTTTAATTTTGGGTAGSTVWLCRPGASPDPCTRDTTATAVSASGTRWTVTATPAKDRTKVDCFYVYPTVSKETTLNADLQIQTAEINVAWSQASQFSSTCDVWAPMYKQITSAGLTEATTGQIPAGGGTALGAISTAYNSLLAGWKDYLANDNHGRPIVLIGHSQGSAMLIKLLEQQIDPDAALRSRLVSAVIAGGNVQVGPNGIDGGSFQHIPACQANTQLHCVIAYSTFPGQPPTGSFFGRPGLGVSILSGQLAGTGQTVLCTNPAALTGGSGTLDPFFITLTQSAIKPFTSPNSAPWVTYPGRYVASCQHGEGATWLNVVPTGGPSDTREVVTETLGPLWGYHPDDVNLALGNLVKIVTTQVAAAAKS
jgi:hypothetical protein